MELSYPNQLSVLLVEKDPDSSRLMINTLRHHPTLPSDVDHAESFEQALKKLRSHSYHLLLVETDVEDEDVFELFDEVQRLNLQIPFVLMLPVYDDVIVRQAMTRGIADLIVKSENHYRELSQRLRDFYSKFHKKNPNENEKGKKTRVAFEETAIFENAGDKVSIIDELTGLYNHSYFHDRVLREFSSAARYGYPLSCLMLDIDQFGVINQEKGYALGDALLRESARLLFEGCRLSDSVCRFGGEEFAVLLPHIDYAGAGELANRLCEAFAEKPFQVNFQEILLTVSIGISSFPEDPMKGRCELLTYASQALLRSKTAGRNRVTLYKEIMPVFGGDLPTLRISEEKVIEFLRRLTDISTAARRSYVEASKVLIMALENKDRFTAGHAARCAKYSMQVAEMMGMSVDEVEVVEHAALLHDIGKICILDEVLLKPGRLSFQEFETMKQHPYFGYKILKPIKFLQEEAVLVLHHHEWFNGEGYPCSLKGNEIPLGSRIIAVIDSYDTMRIAGGRYKKTMTVEDAVNELISMAGTQYDPAVVQAFIEVLCARKELPAENYDKGRLQGLIELQFQ